MKVTLVLTLVYEDSIIGHLPFPLSQVFEGTMLPGFWAFTQTVISASFVPFSPFI